MPVQYCTNCHKYIDLDLDVEHFEDHMRNEEDNGEDQDEGFEFVKLGADANDAEHRSIELEQRGWDEYYQ